MHLFRAVLLSSAFALAGTCAHASTLNEALTSAYATNPQLKAERENLRAIDEGISQAVSGFRPSAVAEYDKGRERTRFGASGWDYTDSETTTLTVNQPLFRGGETLANYKSARARVKAGRARLHAAEQRILLDTVTAYADLIEAVSVVNLNRNNVDVLEEQLGATRSRFDAGELTRTDVAQSEARKARAEADLRRAEGDRAAARATFERIIGFSPKSLELPGATPALPASLDETIEQAKSGNPDAIAATFDAKAARREVDARIANILPDVDLVGYMSRSEGGGFPGVNSFDNDSLTVNVSIPLYQSGAEYSRVREAKDRRERARFTQLDTANAVVENATRAWEDYQASLAVIRSTESSIEAADLALQGVRRENEYGVRTILDVLDAEQELLVSRVNLVRAKRDSTVHGYRLLAAVGRLTAKDLELDVEPYDATAHYDTVKWLPAGF